MAKNLVLWVVIALVLMMVFKGFGNPATPADIPYSEFISKVKTGQVTKVRIEGNAITGLYSDNNRFTTYSPETNNEALIGTLLD
ncbi:MAG: ATP-dependent metallopeptidase FtsH/Yme1/Tma family protein, partial [Pseudomonadota bacterium]